MWYTVRLCDDLPAGSADFSIWDHENVSSRSTTKRYGIWRLMIGKFYSSVSECRWECQMSHSRLMQKPYSVTKKDFRLTHSKETVFSNTK